MEMAQRLALFSVGTSTLSNIKIEYHYHPSSQHCASVCANRTGNSSVSTLTQEWNNSTREHQEQQFNY